ncbi:coatamer subunit protein [Moelleriella libera RCEF 2490]|uniref:Coatamer subunit protein n=1 Tax=Moelleriella libera RCEF 2490 TaxID=1081109 RepID=A0A162IQD6_9HYPO|nr:coatamer subunit protein [Moelleriella libera RCEF 2490]
MSSGTERNDDFAAAKVKLQKPTKQSAFERSKAEAEAKRKREAEETAAVYADFVKSFDRDDDDRRDSPAAKAGAPSRGRLGPGGGRGGAPPPSGHGASKRHFVSSGLKSGPGSLGPPPMSFAKKRSFNDFRGTGGRPGGPDDAHKSTSVATAFNASDDEDAEELKDRAEEKAIAKPTLKLANLPPGTSPAVVKALIPENLSVENVKILPPVGPGGSERKCVVAIVTLSKETPAHEMDTAVSALQNRYLGNGHYLSLHRHLSSAVVGSAALPSLSSSISGAHPFGAKPVEQASTNQEKPAHHQPGFRRGFAPPTSYGPAGLGVSRTNLLHVPVQPPQDVRIIQLINKTIEGVLEHGPEFEALLMSRSAVQREEQWAWIWDARSRGGTWYRWRLWQIITGSEFRQVKGKYVPLFDGGHAWKSPEKGLTFEYTTSLDEFVSDAEYNSSDDEDTDAEGNGDHNGPELELVFLNPLDKAKLVHLLARLPTALSKLRKGDIARVTTFAITHASRGADEVVDMVVANVERPLSLTLTESKKKQGMKPIDSTTSMDDTATNEATDPSGASLVALYVVSDILSSSSTSGVRHAWRFRQLFETAIREHKVFERLGTMAERFQWGRLRAEKWKRSIHLVLSLWEGWCVFPAESHELFVKTFESPPTAKAEDNADESANRAKWKSVEALPLAASERMVTGRAATTPSSTSHSAIQDDVDGEALDEDDVMGEPIDEEDVEGEPIGEDDVEGEPIADEELDGEPMGQDESGRLSQEAPSKDEEGHIVNDGDQTGPGRGAQRRRMRAADMFAD